MATFWFIVAAVLLFGNWLWFVAFTAYRKEIKRQLRKAGFEKYASVYMADLEGRLDEAQRKGHLQENKNTGPIYHFNEDGSTVVLNEDRIEFLQSLVNKGPAGMELDHISPISKAVNNAKAVK